MTPPPEGAAPPREVTLGGGRVLRVRPMVRRDAQALYDLYVGLDIDDRYRRFFCGSLPTREFVERLVEAAMDRGRGLVVEVVDGDDVELVGEATYVAPRSTPREGDYEAPELAITIARPWRGWLGPYLLDALLEDARAAGVDNLQADVLSTNGPMLALVRRHGYATIDDDDWSEVRVLLGAGAPAPSWPGGAAGTDRPRLLVEGRAGRWVPSNEGLAGLRVWRCPASDARTCPALRGGRCALVDGADAVVVAPVRDDERWARLEASHHDTAPDVAVFVDPGGNEVAVAEEVAAAARRHHANRGPGPRSGPG